MAPFFAALIKSGLGLVANAAIEKGSEYLEEKTGLKVDLQKELRPEELAVYKQFMLEHEQELQRIQLERDHISAELFKASLADTQGARQREVDIAISDAPTINKIITPVLAIGVLALTFVLFGVAAVEAI